MLQASAHVAGLDPLTGAMTLPLSGVAALAALALVLGLLAYSQSGREGPLGILACIALLLVGATTTWFILDGSNRRDVAAERRALDARALDLTARAITPGSALACLDASAGDPVEGACEKALFATPEATAAAVSYVSAQLRLLADATVFARSVDPGYQAALTSLRHAAELDRFGIVAHVLAARDGCTSDKCGAFALLNDPSRVGANLSARVYDAYVVRYAANWPAVNARPGASAAAHPISSATPVVGQPPFGAFFLPSAASIPPVSIMNSEPAASPPEATGTTGAGSPAAKPPPPRRPAQPAASVAPPRVPVDLNAAAARSAATASQ
jgi:hypothetical protein